MPGGMTRTSGGPDPRRRSAVASDRATVTPSGAAAARHSGDTTPGTVTIIGLPRGAKLERDQAAYRGPTVMTAWTRFTDRVSTGVQPAICAPANVPGQPVRDASGTIRPGAAGGRPSRPK